MKRIPKSKISFHRNPYNGVLMSKPSDWFAFQHYCFQPLSFWRGCLKDYRFLPSWQRNLPAFCHVTYHYFDL